MNIISLLLLLSAALPAFGGSKTITYKVGAKSYTGYLAFDSKLKGKRPGIIIAHEWWGISAHEKGVADKLAALGYTALALDLYGEGRHSPDPDKANAWMEAADRDLPQLNNIFDKGIELLKKEPTVDPARLAAIGYGFGGGLVTDQARLSKDLKLVVNYYGGLHNPEGRIPKKPVKAEVLVLVGDQDQYVDAEQINGFKEEMGFLKAKANVVIFKDAFPAFANKLAGESGKKYQMPFFYSADAEKKAWDEVVKNLSRVFKK